MIGGVNNGWAVANTLLGFERGDGATTVSLTFRAELGRLIQLAQDTGRANDPLIRQRLALAHSKVEALRYLGMRSLTSSLGGKTPGPESSIVKLMWSEYHQELVELAMDIIGADATAPSGREAANAVMTDALGSPYSSKAWVMTWLGARPGTIYAGSSQVQRNIIGDRVLGLPREPRSDEGSWSESSRR